MAESRIDNHAAFTWSVADLLRVDYKQSEYGTVVLPLTVLRRLDCVLEPTKPAVLAWAPKLRGQVDDVEPVLCAVAGQRGPALPGSAPGLARCSTGSTSTPRSPAWPVPKFAMGHLHEELVRRFSELSNGTAGEPPRSCRRLRPEPAAR